LIGLRRRKSSNNEFIFAGAGWPSSTVPTSGAGARHINIAHGVYPREPWPDPVLDRLVEFLATGTSTDDGRTYAGGLTKFEPREMERLMVPGPEILAAGLP